MNEKKYVWRPLVGGVKINSLIDIYRQQIYISYTDEYVIWRVAFSIKIRTHNLVFGLHVLMFVLDILD